MTKRLCPFYYDCAPQLKMHIGEKQVKLGFDGNGKMKCVYDKTREILFKGANFRSSMKEDVVIINKPCNFPRDHYKQLYLNQDCKIQHEDTLQSYKKVMCEMDSEELVNSSCAYCNKDCCWTQQCRSCEQHFCSNCHVTEYVKDGDRAVCFSCCD